METNTDQLIEQLVDALRGQAVGFDSKADLLDKLEAIIDTAVHRARCAEHDAPLDEAVLTPLYLSFEFDCGCSVDAPDWYQALIDLEAEVDS